ncbi:MAG: winged helix-turn-helix transcriptional regulator [Acidobacteria bacterium]|nr:winged helix-turn-helix transcriptional regulator [Acidobacteriota bacterium]
MEYRPYKEFFRALGNPTRFQVVQLLRERPQHVGEIVERLGYEQSRVSHSLACLLQCGFVEWYWDGKNKIYQLHAEIVPILAAMDRHLARYAAQLDSCPVLGQESGDASPVVLLAAGRPGRGEGSHVRRLISRSRIRRKV